MLSTAKSANVGFSQVVQLSVFAMCTNIFKLYFGGCSATYSEFIT